MASRIARNIGRKRRALGWTLLTLGVLLCAVWGWSGWWSARFCLSRTDYFLSSGTLLWQQRSVMLDPDWRPGWKVAATWPSRPQWSYWNGNSELEERHGWNVGVLSYDNSDSKYVKRRTVTVFVVLWPWPLAALIAGGLLARSGRKAATGAALGG